MTPIIDRIKPYGVSNMAPENMYDTHPAAQQHRVHLPLLDRAWIAQRLLASKDLMPRLNKDSVTN